MRKILSLFLLCTSLVAFAQVKVVERSARKAPEWLYATGQDYFVATAQGQSIEQAQAIALENVKEQIISAVAQNIKASSQTNVSQRTENDNIVSFLETVRSDLSTQSARVPFLSGISLSKVQDYYWEKHLDKATKKVTYSYSIRYPFKSVELKKLVYEFQSQDRKMSESLDMLEDRLDSVSTSEQIDAAIAQVEVLLKYFFDEVRLNRTQAALGAYRKLYTYIKPVSLGTTTGSVEFALMLGDKRIATSQKPLVKSNCASQIAVVKTEQNSYRVSFDALGCVDTDENYIEVNYRFGGNLVRECFFFTSKENKQY